MASEAASAKLSGNRLKEPGPSNEWSRWLRDKRFGGDADYAEKYLKALDQVRGWIAEGLGEFSKAPDFPGCGGPQPLAAKTRPGLKRDFSIPVDAGLQMRVAVAPRVWSERLLASSFQGGVK